MIAGVVGLTFLGAAVRWRFLDQPMRYDESYNYLNYSSRSPAYIVTHYFPNNHVLHTLMVSAVSRVFGTGPSALRLPAFVAGVLLIPATAWLGWTLSRRRVVALLSALAVCGSSALIEYSANARGYSMLTLFAVVAAVLTLQLIATPSRKGLYAAWGVVGALGAFTVPVMIFAMTGLTAAMLVCAFVTRREIHHWRDTVHGFSIGIGVCGLLTAGLYLPILVAEGLDKLAGTRQIAHDILSAQIPTFGGMLGATWQLWTRDAPIVPTVILIIGGIGFLMHAARERTPQSFLPIIVVVVAMATAGLMQMPLPARTWLMLLPVLLVCAVTGLSGLSPKVARSSDCRGLRASVPIVVLSVIVSLPLFTVFRRPSLCAEPNGLVDVEPALEECQAYGSDRCALVAPYTPATAYYMGQMGLRPLPLPASPSTERVYIVTDARRPLEQLWHRGVGGFESFGPPRVCRLLPESTLFAADRMRTHALAQ